MRVGSQAFLLVSMVIATCVAPPKSRADFLTPVQTRYVPLTDTDWVVTTALDPVTNLPTPFEKFDPTIGTLTGVIIRVQVNFSLEFDFKFTTPSPSTISITANAFLGLNLPNATPLISGPIFSPQTITQTGTSPTTLGIPLTGSQSFGPIILTSPSDLALFIGPGPLFLPVGATANSSFTSSSGNGFGAVHTKVGVTVTLQFEFVPEPSSVCLIGLGGGTLALVCCFRRRF